MDRATPTRRAVAPPQRDWEIHRDFIIDLYIKQKMALPRLKEHMSLHYNFRAT